jgi:hypothetical protein
MHRVGTDVKCTLGKFGVWGEAAYSFTEPSGKDYTRRKPELSWVTGFDFNFGALEEHYFNAQYFGTLIRGYDGAFGADYAGGRPSMDSIGDRGYMREFYYRSLVQGLGLQTEALLQGLACSVELSFLEGKVMGALDCVAYVPFGYDDSVTTRYGSLVAIPKLVAKPTDNLEITVGSELAWSLVEGNGDSVKLDRDDWIGQMTGDNRVYLEMTYGWMLP